MQAIGYKEFKAYFDKEITADDLKNIIKQHSRNYAKKQITWFRSIKEAVWLKNKDKQTICDIIANDYYKKLNNLQ
jgi:tRNA dimethylallyltransferase